MGDKCFSLSDQLKLVKAPVIGELGLIFEL